MTNKMRTTGGLALTALFLVACGAAPSSDGSESTSQAMRHCTIDNPCDPPPPPPPPPPVCSWDALSRTGVMQYATYGSDPSGQWASAYTTGCVDAQSTDPLIAGERYLIQQGCSEPVRWEAYRNGWHAITFMQLCPYSQALDSYVDGFNGQPMQGSYMGASIEPPRQSWGFTDAEIPHPPIFYQWVVPWECPTCGMSGCPRDAMPETPATSAM